jgi:chromosome partitioning protein
MAKSRLLNKELELRGVFCTMYDGRRNLDKEVERKIKEHFGHILMNNKIRENVKLAEAPAKGLTIFEHDPRSNGARDYMKLVEEFLEREEI